MEIAEEYAHWYHKTYIKLELVKLAKSKEMAFLPYTDEHNKAIEIGTLKKGIAVRNINGYCLDYLHQNFEAYDFYNRAVKLYCSLATFKDRALPLFSFSPHTREEQQKEFVDKIMAKPLDYINGYDFAIDIDEKSWDKGKAYAKKIKDIFDHYQLPYSMNPSGGKMGGWHFHIGYESFKEFFDPVKMIAASYVINKDLQETENIMATDCSLFDLRRVLKCLARDTILPIRVNGKVDFMSIGDLFDAQNNNNDFSFPMNYKNEYNGKGYDYVGTILKPRDKIEVLSYDLKKNIVKWQKVRSMYKRKENNCLAEIGFERIKIPLKITQEHPIATLGRSGVKFLKAKCFNKGKFVIFPKPYFGNNRKKINLLDDIDFDKYKNEIFIDRKKEVKKLISPRLLSASSSARNKQNNSVSLRFLPYLKKKKCLLSVMGAQEKIPSELKITPELCRLIGYVIGDGCVGHKSINFINQNKKLKKDFIRCAKTITNCATEYYGSVVHIQSRVLSIPFIEWVGHGAKNKQIPYFIFDTSLKNKKELLRGLILTDGCISGHNLTYTTISKKLAIQLFYLFSEFGFNPTISSHMPPKITKLYKSMQNIAQGKSRQYSIRVRLNKSHKNKLFLIREKFIEPNKNHLQSPKNIPCRELEKLLYSFVSGTFKGHGRDKINTILRKKTTTKTNEIIEFIEKNKHIFKNKNSEKKLRLFKNWKKNPLQTFFVNKIRKTKPEEVFDLEVSGTGNYIAHLGILLHNCEYSAVFGANKQWNACLPLDDAQFENCRENQFTPIWCLENVRLMNRGAMERKGSPSGIKEFLQEYYFNSPLVKKKRKAKK